MFKLHEKNFLFDEGRMEETMLGAATCRGTQIVSVSSSQYKVIMVLTLAGYFC